MVEDVLHRGDHVLVVGHAGVCAAGEVAGVPVEAGATRGDQAVAAVGSVVAEHAVVDLEALDGGDAEAGDDVELPPGPGEPGARAGGVGQEALVRSRALLGPRARIEEVEIVG